MEEQLKAAYRELVATNRPRLLTDENDNDPTKIQPSTIPTDLNVVSEEDMINKQRTVIPPEVIPPPYFKRSKERTSDEDTDEEEKRSWKRSKRSHASQKTSETREIHRRVVIPDMFDLPSEEEDEEQEEIREKPDRRAGCPIFGCNWRTRKLRNHVNVMHLPKIMWDNHSPAIRKERYEELNNIRLQVLQFFARQLTGSNSLFALLGWCTNQTNLIPRRAIAIGRHIEQMRSLTATMQWRRPVYNRYTLYPPNHTSVLIHWRYQVGMLQHLSADAVREYLNFGLSFMNDPMNFEPPSRRKSGQETLLSRSLYVPTANKEPQPEWDESQGPPAQRELEKIVTVDVCGEPDEMDPTEEVHQQVEEADEMQATVVIGPTSYTLVLRGTTLHISSDPDHRRQSSPLTDTAGQIEWQERQVICKAVWEAHDVYDSHFHLDRSSQRLLGNVSLTMDTWLDEPMERPPTVPVNVIGGMLIYCDPETFPHAVPIEDKWKVAVGVHPKKVHQLTEYQYDHFIKLIKSSRVTAVGEIGMDRTVSSRFWDKQLDFLGRIAPHIKQVNKPIILHVRSNRYDHYSQLLYMVLLKFCSTHFSTNQKIILHCFTGTYEIQQAWLSHFPNTFFGFTYLVSKFDSKQSAALQAIPTSRLLVETDSPYITPQGITTNSPIYLGEVVEIVAQHRRVSTESICRSTTVNATTVFGHC